DSKIEAPGRSLIRGQDVHDGAEGTAVHFQDLVDAVLADRHAIRLAPAEAAGIEGKGGRQTGGRELLPLEMAQIAGRERPAPFLRGATHDGKDRALRIGDDREAANPRDVGGRHELGGAVGQKSAGRRIDIIDPDIADPTWLRGWAI